MRFPTRPRTLAPGTRDAASGQSRSASPPAGAAGVAGRGADRAPADRATFRPSPTLLGRDQVAVVRLAAVHDLDLRAGPEVVDPTRQRLGRREIAALAVVDRDELEARAERLDRAEHRLGR